MWSFIKERYLKCKDTFIFKILNTLNKLFRFILKYNITYIASLNLISKFFFIKKNIKFYLGLSKFVFVVNLIFNNKESR